MTDADIMHRAPYAEGHPSFTAAVSSIALMAAKYIALSVQVGHQEIIDNLEEMWVVCCFTLINQVGCLSLTAV